MKQGNILRKTLWLTVLFLLLSLMILKTQNFREQRENYREGINIETHE